MSCIFGALRKLWPTCAYFSPLSSICRNTRPYTQHVEIVCATRPNASQPFTCQLRGVDYAHVYLMPPLPPSARPTNTQIRPYRITRTAVDYTTSCSCQVHITRDITHAYLPNQDERHCLVKKPDHFPLKLSIHPCSTRATLSTHRVISAR